MRKEVLIRKDHIIGRPNPGMWGIFYEEINHAGDGGLYAELLRNRSFADSRLPDDTVYANGKAVTRNGFEVEFDPSDPLPGWYLRKDDSAAAAMDLTEEAPRNPECAQQLRLSVLNPGAGVQVCNQGYWGIPLKKQRYYGFCILRGTGVRHVRAGLMHASGVVICSQELSVTENFEKVSFEMTSDTEITNGRFFLEVTEPGTLYLDFVTLFPEDTDQGRPFGFRRDLMDMLRGLKPGFLRFPGGCVVEGFNLADAIHWKKTRGPVEDRPGHWDLWGYRATDGLGMLEFCQLGEDLDADLMYVANVGMSCQFRNCELADDAGIQWWLQNALDAIEYIAGDVSTPWGALRARDGHPEPFRLKYVEIGNEQHGQDYFKRYKIFYEAIKARYPQLTLIATVPVPDAPMDMVDDHYYTRPQTFPNMYKAYEDQGVPVYVGEYACNSDVGLGNLLGAVSDATFMIRMENRCDRIRIASYAPLFCNDHDRTWPVNLINFDGSRVFGIPSYEVQRLFANHPVDHVLETHCPILDGSHGNLHVTAGEKDGNLIVKLANYGTVAMEAVIGTEGCAFTGDRACLVASGSEQDANSLLDPHLVSTVEIPVRNQDGRAILDLPACSFAVLIGHC